MLASGSQICESQIPHPAECPKPLCPRPSFLQPKPSRTRARAHSLHAVSHHRLSFAGGPTACPPPPSPLDLDNGQLKAFEGREGSASRGLEFLFLLPKGPGREEEKLGGWQSYLHLRNPCPAWILPECLHWAAFRKTHTNEAAEVLFNSNGILLDMSPAIS